MSGDLPVAFDLRISEERHTRIDVCAQKATGNKDKEKRKVKKQRRSLLVNDRYKREKEPDGSHEHDRTA